MRDERGGIRRGSLPADNFTVIENDWLRDPKLSYKARGLLALLASHERGWVVRLTDLVTEQDKIASVRAGVRELEAHGYLRRSRVREADGAYGPDLWEIGSPNLMRYSHVEDAAHSTC